MIIIIIIIIIIILLTLMDFLRSTFNEYQLNRAHFLFHIFLFQLRVEQRNHFLQSSHLHTFFNVIYKLLGG